MCVNSAAERDSSQTKTQVASLACGKAVAAKRKTTRKHEAVPASPIVATISEDVFRNRVERRQKCRTSSLPSVWCPPVPRPPSLLVFRSSLSRDLPSLSARRVASRCRQKPQDNVEAVVRADQMWKFTQGVLETKIRYCTRVCQEWTRWALAVDLASGSSSVITRLQPHCSADDKTDMDTKKKKQRQGP